MTIRSSSITHNLTKTPTGQDQSTTSVPSNGAIGSTSAAAPPPSLFPPLPVFSPAPFPLSPPATVRVRPLPSQTTSRGTGRGGPLTRAGALQHIPPSPLPGFDGNIPLHLDGQGWKSWLSGQTDRRRQLEINPVSLRIIAPDIRTGARLLWSYLLDAPGAAPSSNANQHGDATISKFPLLALFTRDIGCWSMYVLITKCHLSGDLADI